MHEQRRQRDRRWRRPTPGGRRRIDSVLAEEFLDGSAPLTSTRFAADATRPSKKKPTCPTSAGCCRGGWTSCAPSCTPQRRRRRVRWSTSSPASWPTARLAHRTEWVATSRVEPSRVADHRRAVEQLVSDVGVSDVVGRSEDELADSLTRLGRVRARRFSQPPPRARSHGPVHRRDRPALPVRRSHRRRPARPLVSHAPSPSARTTPTSGLLTSVRNGFVEGAHFGRVLGIAR